MKTNQSGALTEIDFSKNIEEKNTRQIYFVKDPKGKITYHFEQHTFRKSEETNDFVTFRNGVFQNRTNDIRAYRLTQYACVGRPEVKNSAGNIGRYPRDRNLDVRLSAGT